MTREIGLVSCVKTKREQPAVPKNLYTSTYFEKMSNYAEQIHDDWFILSAKHGLLDPDGEPIAPYEETLRDATKSETKEWAQTVAKQLKERDMLSANVTLVVHAGRDYYAELIPLIEDSVADVQIPTEGLAIGETMAWYKNNL